MLTGEELERYKRQIMMRGFGEEAQEKLKKARVFVGGVGGLGCPSMLYLAAAGIGTIRMVDSDSVELSNLNRQVLHWTPDISRDKVESALDKLNRLNPEVKIEAVKERMTESNIRGLVEGFDLIVDATDNLATRYLLNQTAMDLNIPFFHGAVHGLEGRALTILPGQSACIMCIYRGVNITEKPPVFGVTPAIIACIQVTEVIKYLAGIGELLIDRLLVYDGLNMKFAELKLRRDPSCKHCGKLV
jgi:molybdopterin-synthase adenylyltransferase